jgi:hypothetical protein
LRNEDCFLESPEWNPVLLSMSTPKDSELHPIAVSMWIIQVRIPRLLRQTGEYLFYETNDPAVKTELTLQVLHVRDALLQWREQYEELTKHPGAFEAVYKLRELSGLYIAALIFVTRCHIALNVLDGSAQANEQWVQNLADIHVNLSEEAAARHAQRSNLLFARTIAVTNATQKTRDEWSDAIYQREDCIDRERGVIRTEIFEHWNCLMGRKVTNRPDILNRVKKEIETDNKTWLTVASIKHKYFEDGSPKGLG